MAATKAQEPDLFDLPVDELVALALTDLQRRSAEHDQTWHLGRADWAADTEAGVITFTTDEHHVECDLQIVGTLGQDSAATPTEADGTWMWSWENPAIPDGLCRHAELVRAYGLRHDIDAFLMPEFPTDEATCWQLAALASKLGGAAGAYRGPAGDAAVFLTFGEPVVGPARPTPGGLAGGGLRPAKRR